MAEPILTLPGKTNSSNALVIKSTGSTGQSAGAKSAVGAIATLPGKVDSANRLHVRLGGS